MILVARPRPLLVAAAVLTSVGLLAVPTQPGHAAAAVPTPVLSIGTRLTWQSGDSTLEGAKLVPDPNGWLWKDDQWWDVTSSGGSGGIGLEQVDIVGVGPAGVVGDVRYFLNTDLQRNTHVSSGVGLVVGDANGLGDYWVPPASLAAMQDGFDGTTRVWRGPRQFGTQTFDTVSVAIVGSGSYVSKTFDVATGLLLIGGTMNAAPGVLVTDESGNPLDEARGAVSYTHRVLAGTRQLNVPWAGAPLPDWATVGLVTSYQGQIRGALDDTAGLPQLPGQAVSVDQIFDQRVGDALIGRQVTSAATTEGLPPTESTTQRVYASAMLDGLWIPPDALARLQPEQVLDQDPLSGQTISFGGVQQNAALIVASGPTDQLVLYYDTTSGLLVASRYQLQMATGTQTTELTLVGQR